MRLLHVDTREFREFFDEQVPPYAILSHRWGKREDEMSYQEWISGHRKNCDGLRKIQQCCALALQDKLWWVWVDTCCIDKASSAELTEAINSMFQWYSKATKCYAYLADVNWPYELAVGRTGGIEDSSKTKQGRYGTFGKSEWFERGWTLQELLAPKTVLFYDYDWDFLGSKNTLADDISHTTLIQTPFLNSSRALSAASVASKMSWVSKRKTTRIEDLAYCLLGIFDVNMPLLYGEKDKAFYRLQLEIVKVSNDESIFAWTSNDSFSGMPLVIELRPKGGDWVRSKCSTLQAYKSGTTEHTTVLGPKSRTGIAMARIYIIDTMMLQRLQWREDNLKTTPVPENNDTDKEI